MMITQRKFGWLPDRPGERDVVFTCMKPADFTRIHDLRWAGVIPPVRDQLDAGACTGFGTTAGAWSAMLSDKTFNTPAFHPSELFAYFNGRQDKNNDTGASIREVVKATSTFGLAPVETWLYDVKNVCIKPSERAFSQALKFKTIKYARVEQTEQAIVNTLASGYPIIFGHLTYENFYKVGKDGLVPMPKGKMMGGHCELQIGYNLNTGRVTTQNSWGEGHGDRGYEYFSFEHILNPAYCMDFWVIYEVSI